MTQEMCKKAVYIYPSTLMHVPNCYKIQLMCEKAVGTCPFILDYVRDCYKTQEMREKASVKNLSS